MIAPEKLPPSPPRDPFDTSHLIDDIKGRSVRGGAVTVTTQALRFALRMGSTVVLARLLTPGDFGLVAMVTALTGFAMMFRDLGLSTATIQQEQVTHRQISNLFWINVAVSLLVAGILLAAAPAVAWFYADPRLTPIARALALAFVFGGLGVQHQALLRRQMRFAALGIVAITGMACGVAAAIAAAALGAGYWSLVIMAIVTEAATTLANLIACPWRPGLPSRRASTRPMLRFGSHITGFNVVNYFARNLDNILIGRFVGAAPLGLYAKAYGLMLLPIQQINAPLSAVAIPAMSRLNSSPDRYRQYYAKAVRLMACVIMPFSALVAVMSEGIILLVLGRQWAAAAPLLSVFALSMFIDPVANPVGWLLTSQGRTVEYFRLGLLGALLTAVSIDIGLNWGIIGVAAAYSLTAVGVRTPIQLWYVGRAGPVSASNIISTVSWPAFGALVLLPCLFALRILLADYHYTLPLVLGFVASGLTVMLIVFLSHGHHTIRHFGRSHSTQ